MHLEEARGRVGDEALLGHQVLAIQGPPFLRRGSRKHPPYGARQLARCDNLEMMAGNALVKGRTRKLGAAMQPPRLVRPRQGDEERPARVAAECRWTLIGGEWNHRAQKIRRWPDDQLAVRHRYHRALDREFPRGAHGGAILLDGGLARRCVLAQQTHDVAPGGIRPQLRRKTLELRDRLGPESLTETQQLVGVLANHVSGVELEVEQL